MRHSTRWFQRFAAGITAVALVVGQLTFLPSAEAAHLGSATASAGSAPPPSVSAIQSFQPDLFTGRATTAIPIAVPPGRKGMQPALALAYSSSSRNGPVGVGWSLDVGYIERSTKHGVPKYDASDTYTFLFQGVNSDLVHIGGSEYRAKDEGLFLKFTNHGVSGWEVRDKSGTRYLFGQDATSQMVDQGHIFRWGLDQVIDTNGNSLSVTYTIDQHQLYLSRIDYTAHEPTHLAPANRVELLWEGREDVETSYRSGFAVTTAKRLSAIETRATVNGSLALARRYELRYSRSTRTDRSLLTSVKQIGTDGVTALPPTTFTYTQDPPTYLHCHNCVPGVTQGNNGWQVQVHVGELFPSEREGNDQKLWPTTPLGSFDPGWKWVAVWYDGPPHCAKKKACEVMEQRPIPPVPWGNPFLEQSGSSSGISWSTDTLGNLSASGPQDSHLLAITWLHNATSTTKTVAVPVGGSNHADVFYVPTGSSTWTIASGNQVPLSPGWTIVAVTAYNETGSLSLSMSADLASQVAAMNHAQFSPMSLTGDFNGDGFTDLAHVTASPERTTWQVLLNSYSGFGQAQTWRTAPPSAETASLVGDANADGKADLILWNASSGLWQVATSTGSSFDAPTTWHSGFGAGQTPFMGDVNGDQTLDVGTTKDGTWTMALSTGSSFASPTTWLSSFGAGATPLTGDFNGDGLTDVAAASSGTISVALSDGTRLVSQPSAWTSGFGAGQSVTSADLNGDGLTDVVYYDKGTGAVVYAPSTGQGFATAQTLMSDHPFPASLRGESDVFQVGDFRGNGLSGFGVFNPYSGVVELASALGTPPDLLSELSNGLGGTTTLQYLASTQCDNVCPIEKVPKLPFIFPVVQQVTLRDGLGHEYATTYHYQQGRYDPTTKEFRGFGLVEVRDPENTVSRTTFAQDDHTKGRPLTAEVLDRSGRLYTRTSNTWSSTSPSAGIHFATLAQTESAVCDGNDTCRTVRSRFTYDEHGNLTRTDEEGEVAVTGDERASRTEYLSNTTDWILNRSRLAQTLNAAGAVVSQRRFFYDEATDTTTAPTKGYLTREEEWLNTPAEQWLGTTLTYDAYGNVKTVTDALGRTTTNTYEATGTYLTQIENVLGHTRTLSYNPLTGQVTASTDQNGLTSLTTYDTLGRVTQTSFVDPDTNTDVVTSRIDYDPCLTSGGCTNPIRTITSITQSPNHSITTYQFTDGLGRTLQTRSPAEDPAKQVVTGIVELNTRGLVSKQWVSYLDEDSTSYRPVSLVTGHSSLATVSYTYDPLGRLTQTTDPDGATTTTSYDDGTVTLTDANGHEMTRTADAYGRLTTVEEVVSDTEVYTTTYTYDTLGSLIRVRDHAGNTTTITYDSLGRKTAMDDPDMGHWTYAYDAVDNLTSQTDARGVVITFTYDALNRLTQKSYTVPSSLVTDHWSLVTVHYTYDNPAKDFSKGKLTEIADGSGSSSFDYDALGRLITETKTVSATLPGGSASGGDGATHTIQRRYDLLGRLTALTYPDSDEARYTYNPQGGLETVSLQSPVSGLLSLVSDGTYNAAGQLTSLATGSGITTTYAYDPQTLRLSSLVTRHQSLGTVLQDYAYAFDPIGNVTSIRGGVASTTGPTRDATQTFTYDPLDRLTRAEGPYGDLRYAYDPLGNLTEKDGARLTYGQTGGAKPHAVTSFTGPLGHSATWSLTYDANGNLTAKIPTRPLGHLVTQSLAYDADNRLIEVKTAPDHEETLKFAPGWNFFSLPVIPDDPSIAALFAGHLGKIEQVARFVSSTGHSSLVTGHFDHFVHDPAFNDFDTLAYGVGYQLYATDAFSLTVKGKLPTTSPVTEVEAGWQFLPSLGLESGVLSPQFPGLAVERVLRYDTSNRSLTSATTTTPGAAYYVKVAQAGRWQPALPKDPTTRFVYDGDGGRVKSITAEGTTTYLGELVELAPDGTTTKYVYAGGQRIASLEMKPTARVASSAPQPPVTSHSSLVTRLVRWLARLDKLLAFVFDVPAAEAAELPSGLRFFHPDHLGSVNLVTDATGQVVESTTHTPFGSVAHRDRATSHQSLVTGHSFTGQREDARNGLILFPARPYDPELGRFLQPDPFVQDPADPQSLNRYAYVRNNPVNLVDPSGNFWQFIVAAIAAIAFAVFVVSAVVSIYASTVSLIASATGHENTARRAAKVAVASGQVAFWSAATLSIATGGEASGTMVTASLILAYAHFAQGVARNTDAESNQSLGPAIGRSFLNTAAEHTPGISQLFGLGVAISGANPFTQELLSPLERALLGGASLLGLRGPTARVLALRLTNPEIRHAPIPGKIVIGETMSRVTAKAKELGAKFYRPRKTVKEIGMEKALANNERWIRRKMKEGWEIIDSGIDPKREGGRSPFYEMERKVLEEAGYPVTRQ